MTEVYQSREQLRAAHAWNIVQEVKSGKKVATRFGLEAKRMPVRILASGLGPALAFLAAKKYAPPLQEALNDWITRHCDWARHASETTSVSKNLMERIMIEDAEFLRMATDECMAYLQWLVRFSDAEGLIKEMD